MYLAFLFTSLVVSVFLFVQCNSQSVICCQCRCCNDGNTCTEQNGNFVGQFQVDGPDSCTLKSCKSYHNHLLKTTCPLPSATFWKDTSVSQGTCVEKASNTKIILIIVISALVGLLVVVGVAVAMGVLCKKERDRKVRIETMKAEIRQREVDKAKVAAVARIQAADDFDLSRPIGLYHFEEDDYEAMRTQGLHARGQEEANDYYAKKPKDRGTRL
eukprot:Platyproteum_vivax@DN14395_c0_g1_i1.p1